MKIAVDSELCVGSGLCAHTSPSLFDQNQEDGRAIVLQPRPEPGLRPDARRAAALCPVGAIRLSVG